MMRCCYLLLTHHVLECADMRDKRVKTGRAFTTYQLNLTCDGAAVEVIYEKLSPLACLGSLGVDVSEVSSLKQHSTSP